MSFGIGFITGFFVALVLIIAYSLKKTLDTYHKFYQDLE